MLDHTVIGRVTRISPEAPVPVVEHDRDVYHAGGAANVANNVHALGGVVELVGLVGTDGLADVLREELRRSGVGVDGLVADASRPTTTKQRIVTTRNQHVARVDYESDHDAGPAIEVAMLERVKVNLQSCGVVLISDYLKGAVTRSIVSHIIEMATSRQIPVLVDPKVPHLDYYGGATVITPNNLEAETATHVRIRTDEDANRAGAVFLERARCRSVLITRGEHGMSLVGPDGNVHFPAVAREVADVTGAGDTVIAALALGLAAGSTLAEAAQVANLAAGVVVSRFGAATVTPAELLASIGA